MALGALGTLVDDLRWGVRCKSHFQKSTDRENDEGLLTMAVMELPLGPVTLTQAPHSAALFHTAPEYAVPYKLLGMVDSVVKEHVPPFRLPP